MPRCVVIRSSSKECRLEGIYTGLGRKKERLSWVSLVVNKGAWLNILYSW
jgi:hypothetical protein